MFLAFGGIITAFILIALWMASVLSFNTLAILSLSSFLIGVMYIESGTKNALLCYVASSVLALILPVDKTNALVFLLFFGYYPILKAYIEKADKLIVEILIKAMLFTLVSFGGVYISSKVFFVNISEVLPLWSISTLGILFFFIYDYVLSILFDFYIKKIRNKIRK